MMFYIYLRYSCSLQFCQYRDKAMQLITIGILAEIAVRTYYESQSKKTYQVRKVYHKEKVRDTLEITV